MDITKLMNNEMSRMLKKALSFYMRSGAGRKFLLSYGTALKKKESRRKLNAEKNGVDIPPFLITSITDSCNLNCAGCYAKADRVCSDGHNAAEELTDNQWAKIFDQADDLGISFILLAGGEPLTKPTLLETAARYRNIIFPVFTNGTLLDEDMLDLFDKNRNLIPVLSIEGGEEETNDRRGTGVFQSAVEKASELSKRNILFGASITVTKANIDKVTDDSFVDNIKDRGCGLIFYVEYVPIDDAGSQLVLGDEELTKLSVRTDVFKEKYKDMIVIAFPGDEDSIGGCLAAGRGFFHINPTGGAEPCPFSPYSKMNLKVDSIIDILKSDYFKKLKEITAEEEEHYGGCTLYNKRELVAALMN